MKGRVRLTAEMKGGSKEEINLEEFYTRYGPMVLRRCRTMLGNEQAAYDAMQEVFLNVLKNRSRLKAAYPSALLYRIATNVCLNKIRSDRIQKIDNRSDIIRHFHYSVREEDKTFANILWDFILEKEKGFMRAMAVMYFINGMTIQEIASVMNLSISGVHKNLEQLRGRMKRKGEAS